MELKPVAHTMIKRMVPPVALWITTKILETPKVKGGLQEVDSATHVAVKRAARNAKKNPVWVAASAVALAVAIGCLIKASSSR
jgi:hypothetical protein